MIPELFKIGPFTVYSYGLMLAVAFIVAGYILTYEFRRTGLPENLASEITLIAIFLGIAGSKLFYLFEDWSNFSRDPIGTIFSAGGLTYYGGFLLASAGIAYYVRKKKIRFLRIADLASPSLAVAYGIGRIGCHLAGDGDYGLPTSLPWGMNYEKGIVPPSVMFRGSKAAAAFPNGFVPDNTLLHPTPLYEFLGSLVILYILWMLRKKISVTGRLFMVYLVLTGIARFFVEFLRLNPDFFLGMTEAQTISIALICIGIVGYFRLQETREPAVEVQSAAPKRRKNSQ